MMFHAVMLPTIRRVAATRSSPNTQQRTVRMVGNFVALSIVGSVTANRQFISTATFCEGNDKNGGGGIFDAILPKKSDGTIDWDKAKGLISLDQIGKLSGSQVRT